MHRIASLMLRKRRLANLFVNLLILAAAILYNIQTYSMTASPFDPFGGKIIPQGVTIALMVLTAANIVALLFSPAEGMWADDAETRDRLVRTAGILGAFVVYAGAIVVWPRYIFMISFLFFATASLIHSTGSAKDALGSVVAGALISAAFYAFLRYGFGIYF